MYYTCYHNLRYPWSHWLPNINVCAVIHCTAEHHNVYFTLCYPWLHWWPNVNIYAVIHCTVVHYNWWPHTPQLTLPHALSLCQEDISANL